MQARAGVALDEVGLIEGRLVHWVVRGDKEAFHELVGIYEPIARKAIQFVLRRTVEVRQLPRSLGPSKETG